LYPSKMSPSAKAEATQKAPLRSHFLLVEWNCDQQWVSRPELFEKRLKEIPNYLKIKEKSETGRGFADLEWIKFCSHRKNSAEIAVQQKTTLIE
jgi:hypothetical protein